MNQSMQSKLSKLAIVRVSLIAAFTSTLLTSGCEAPSTRTEREQRSQQPTETKPETQSEPGVSSEVELAKVESAKIGDTKNVTRFGDWVFAGQFGEADIDAIKADGIEQVITLRGDGEVSFDEAKLVKDAGMKHVSFPIASAADLTDQKFEDACRLLSDQTGKTMLHCGSANRVAAVWIAHRVIDEKVDLETAMAEAKAIGLTSKALEEKAVEYVKRTQQN